MTRSEIASWGRMMRFASFMALLVACGSPAWRLLDGKSLGAWKVTEYGGQGAVTPENGALRVGMGNPLSGIHWSGVECPRTNYEFGLEAMKIDGSDFFCGIIFPVGKESCSFIAGGWGGGVTGLSSVDAMNASENETTTHRSYAKNRWYLFRLRVTPEKIEVWIDKDKVVDLDLSNRHLSVHPSVELACPLGIANFSTTSLFRNVTLKKL